MPDHDPVAFVNGLSAKLATTSRHVCLFLGAGVSRACGLPDVAGLQKKVLEALAPNDNVTFAKQLEGRNLEQALSRLRGIATLLTDAETFNELTAAQAKELDAKVCRAIIDNLNIEAATLEPMLKLAAWVSRARYRAPLELFTVNYDLLIESALERTSVPYFDGFVGALRARFQTELVENFPDTAADSVPTNFTRLWKIHGSVNWQWDGPSRIVRLGQPVAENQPAAIYPSDTKYLESRRLPFVVLHDRLRRALLDAETLVIVSGYSFGDQHLNEVIFDAASRRERSEFLCFFFEEIPAQVAERALLTPNIQAITGKEAIIGGVRGNWKPPEQISDNIWTDNQLALRDFSHLAALLARSGPPAFGEEAAT